MGCAPSSSFSSWEPYQLSLEDQSKVAVNLKKTPYFESYDATSMDEIMTVFERKMFNKDEHVFEVNGNSDYLFFLLSGKATLQAHSSPSDPNQPTPVLISHGLITADLIAKQSKARNFGAKCVSDDSVVLRLSKYNMNSIIRAQEYRVATTAPVTPVVAEASHTQRDVTQDLEMEVEPAAVEQEEPLTSENMSAEDDNSQVDIVVAVDSIQVGTMGDVDKSGDETDHEMSIDETPTHKDSLDTEIISPLIKIEESLSLSAPIQLSVTTEATPKFDVLNVAEKKLAFSKEVSVPITPQAKISLKCLGVTLSCNHRGEAIIVAGGAVAPTPTAAKRDQVLEKKMSERGLLDLIKGNTAEKTVAYEKLKKVSAALESTAAIMYRSFRFQGESSWKENLIGSFRGSVRDLLNLDNLSSKANPLSALERKNSMKSESDIFALSRCGSAMEMNLNMNEMSKPVEDLEPMEDIADWISPVV